MKTKPNFNPSPLSNFISNYLLSLSRSLLPVPRSPFPVPRFSNKLVLCRHYKTRVKVPGLTLIVHNFEMNKQKFTNPAIFRKFNRINPFAPEPPVTARADPGPFYPL